MPATPPQASLHPKPQSVLVSRVQLTSWNPHHHHFSIFLSFFSFLSLTLISHHSPNMLSTLITETSSRWGKKWIYPCCGCGHHPPWSPTIQTPTKQEGCKRDSPSCYHKTGVSTGTKADGARVSLNMSLHPEAGGWWAGSGVHTSPN